MDFINIIGGQLDSTQLEPNDNSKYSFNIGTRSGAPEINIVSGNVTFEAFSIDGGRTAPAKGITLTSITVEPTTVPHEVQSHYNQYWNVTLTINTSNVTPGAYSLEVTVNYTFKDDQEPGKGTASFWVSPS